MRAHSILLTVSALALLLADITPAFAKRRDHDYYPHKYDRHDSRYYDRDDHRRHDRGRHRGWKKVRAFSAPASRTMGSLSPTPGA